MGNEDINIRVNTDAAKAAAEFGVLEKVLKDMGATGTQTTSVLNQLEKSHGTLGSSASGLKSVFSDLTGQFGQMGGSVGVLGGAFERLGSSANTMGGTIAKALGLTTSAQREAADVIKKAQDEISQKMASAQSDMSTAQAALAKAHTATGEAVDAAAKKEAKAAEQAAAQQVASAAEAIAAVETEQVAVTEASAEMDAASGGLTIALGIAATAILGIGVLAEQGVGKFMNLAESTHSLMLATGMTAEQASGLIYQFQVLGVSTDRLPGLFQRSEVAMDTNKSKLAALGVQIASNSDGTLNYAKTLENASKAYQSTDNSVTKAGISQAIFARTGGDANSILSQGINLQKDYTAAKAAGVGLNDQQVQQALQLKVAEGQLKESLSGLEQTLAKDVIPAAIGFVHVLGDVIHWVQDASDGLNTVTKHMGMFGTALKYTVELLVPGAALFAALSNAGRSVSTQAQLNALAATEEAKAYDTLLKGAQSLTSELLSLNDAQTKVDQAQLALKENALDQADAQKALTTLLQTHGVDAQTVANDTDTLTVARDSQTKALEAQAKAQTDMNTVMENASLIIEQYQNAYNSAVTSSAQDAVDLQKVQNELMHETDPVKRTQLELDLQKAQEKGVNDQYKQTTAGEDWTKVQQQGIQGTKEWQAAQASIVSANDQVTSTTIGLTKAQAALNTALAGDPNLAEDVQRAQDKLSGSQLTGKSDLSALVGAETTQQELQRSVPTDFANADAAIQAQTGYYLSETGQVGALDSQVQGLLALTAPQDAGSQEYVTGTNGALVPAPKGNHQTGASLGSVVGKWAGLPHYADGGVVGGSTGDPVKAIVHQGEAILNQDQQGQVAGMIGAGGSGSGGHQISIGQVVLQDAGNKDPRQLAQELAVHLVEAINELAHRNPQAGLRL
jgi:hypothetical protein